MVNKVVTMSKSLVLGMALVSGAVNAGLLDQVSDALEGASDDRSVTVEKCVEVPSSDGLFAGVATPLTGPVGVLVPGLDTVTICASTACDVSGSVEVSPEAPSFDGCDVGYTLAGEGEGSCVTTITTKTMLGDKTIYADRSVSGDGYPLLPLEVCVAKVPN